MTISALSRRWGIVLVALAILAGLSLGQLLPPPADKPELEWLTHPRPLASFKLMAGAREFNNQALQGHWQVLALGFTHCSDSCPLVLSQLSALRAAMGDEQLGVIFISIDPLRDTPTELAAYVRFFDNDIVAVSGEETELRHLAASLGMDFRREGPADSPRISHSPTIALIGPGGLLRARLRPGFNTQRAAQQLRAHIKDAS